MEKGNKKDIPVVTKNVKVRKESEVSKFKKNFFAEDGASVKNHIFSTVVIPGLQRLFSDVIKNGIDWLIYGSKSSSGTRSGIRNVSYSNYYERSRSNTNYASGRTTSSSKPGAYSLNEVIFDERGEAEVVLDRMREAIARYTSVSVADFYDMVNFKHAFTDNKWGWDNLSDAEVVRNRNGYSIQFPKVKPLE